MKSAQIRYQEDPLRGLGQEAQEKGDWWSCKSGTVQCRISTTENRYSP